jgi:predicted transcriptional regulator of viral defense system
MKMASIIRRLGFALETLSLVDDALTSKLKAGLPAGAVKLDHDLPIAGKHDAKWGLRLNVSAEEILNVVASPGVHSWLTRGRKHAGAPERR